MPENPPSTSPTRTEHRASPVWSLAGTILRTAILALAVFLVVRLVSSVSWVDLRNRLATASPALLAATFVALIARFAAWQHRWSLALRQIGEPRGLRVRFAALTASILINHVTPTVRLLGGIVRARYLAARQEYGFARVYGAVLFDQLVHHVVSGLFTWAALVGFTWYLGRTTLTWLAVSAAPLLAAYLFWRSRRGEPSPQRRLARVLTRRIRQRSQRFDLFLNRGRETVAVLTGLLKNKPVILQGAFWTAVVFFLNFSAQALLFAAIDARVAPIAVFAVVALGSVAGALAGTPGGIGSTEAAMIAGYAALGIESADAVTAVLAFRGFHYISVIVTGLPSLIWLSMIGRLRAPIIGR
ncbi:MAG: flippase-like domain-containing protein [Acidobacteriota bacterium]|nr:flippase-like domain-containing protein [Acidobacteriota bacterium]